MVRLWNFLASRAVAMALLIAISAIILIGSIVPNPAYMTPEEIDRTNPILLQAGQAINIQRVSGTWAFGLISLLLLLSTLGCTLQRIRRRNFAIEEIHERKLWGFHFNGATEGKGQEELLHRLRKSLRRGWKLKQMEEGERAVLVGRKGEMGFWGSILFHLSLLTVILGVFLHSLMGFRGTMLFTEGQERVIDEENFVSLSKRPLLKMTFPGLRLTLKKFSSSYVDDKNPVEYRGEFILRNGTGASAEKITRINDPLNIRGIQFLMMEYGFSPHFVIRDKAGKVVLDGYIALKVVGATDSFSVPRLGMVFHTWFYPDFHLEGKTPVTRSPLPRNPVFYIQAVKEGRKIYGDFVRLGEAVQGEEFELSFVDLRYWISLDGVKETGMGLFFTSVLIGTGGMFLRFLFPDHYLIVEVAQGQWHIKGYSLYSQEIFREKTAEMAARWKLSVGGYPHA